MNSKRLIAAVLLFFLCLVSAEARAVEIHKILVLHSFNQNNTFERRFQAGLETVLANSGIDVEVFHEYMDAPRYVGPEYKRIYFLLSKYKYNSQQFDVIITYSNEAYRFLFEDDNHQTIFGLAPWVFCGVNDVFYESLGSDRIRSTGLTVMLDLAATVQIALLLHPDRNIVYALMDKAGAQAGNIKFIQDEILNLAKRHEIRFMVAPSRTEFIELLKTMPSNALLLLLASVRDEGGNNITFQEVKALIRQYGHVPVYTLWEGSMGDGIVGGKITSATSQGRGAAQMALRIIRGEKPTDIPVVHGLPNQFVFNYTELKRFGVSLSALPEGSVVLNRPPSFYTINKTAIWLIMAGFVFLSLITLFLAFNLIQRKRAEKALIVTNALIADEYEQRKRLSSHLIDLLEQDRRDVAMDLHDHIGQILTTMKLSLAKFKNGSTAGGEEFKRFTTGAEANLDLVMKGIKDTINGLRPMALELQGLKSALQSLMADMEASSGLKIHFFYGDVPDRIDDRKELALYRIIQEAVNNAIKHSGARNVHINLIKRDNALSLSIEDDGDGFDFDGVLSKTGTIHSLGLVLMRERALQVGGNFHIDSHIGKGTHILVGMPIE